MSFSLGFRVHSISLSPLVVFSLNLGQIFASVWRCPDPITQSCPPKGQGPSRRSRVLRFKFCTSPYLYYPWKIMHLHMTHDLVAIPASDYLIPNLRQSRHIHPLAFVQTPTLKDYYKFTFFPRTVIHWNALPTKIILLPTLVQFSNAVCQVAHIFHLKFQYLFLSFNYINPLTPYCINSFHQLFITLIPLTHFSSLFTGNPSEVLL